MGMNDAGPFMEIYVPLSLEFPLSLTIQYLHTGIPRWRIGVFGKGMAKVGNGTCDAQLLHVEEKEWQQAIEKATKDIKKVSDNLRTKPFGAWNA